MKIVIRTVALLSLASLPLSAIANKGTITAIADALGERRGVFGVDLDFVGHVGVSVLALVKVWATIPSAVK